MLILLGGRIFIYYVNLITLARSVVVYVIVAFNVLSIGRAISGTTIVITGCVMQLELECIEFVAVLFRGGGWVVVIPLAY
jgi:hypothetical protein